MLLHLFAIPALVYQSLLHFEQPVWISEKLLAESVAREVQNEIAIHQLASKGNKDQVQKTINAMFGRYNFVSLAVYNDAKQLRAFRGKPKHSPYPSNLSQVSLVPGSEQVSVTRWVPNEAACQTCHSSAKPNIGAIEATLSLSAIALDLNQKRTKAMVVTFLILFGVFSLIYFVHHYFITAPVDKMMKAMVRVKEGDLSVQIPVTRKDELATMAENFNEVVRSLRTAKLELEKRHHADMYRAEQLASVGEIAAGLAHEVKNPLAGIKSALEVVVSETNEGSQHKEILKQIIEEIHRIALIINNLLDYARPRPSKPEWCDIQMIAGDIQHIFGLQCQKQSVSFEMQVEDNPGSIFVDTQELRQILMNILRNGLEAVNGSGAIRMHVAADDKRVLFSISDNGIGMDRVTQERIFQPFFTTKPSGTGLGLAIVSRLVKDTGGSLHLTSKPGAGTTFEVILPREASLETADR
jgi:signal transduction histidine kinase